MLTIYKQLIEMISNCLKRTISNLSTYTNNRQPQPIFNPNLSLISNIAQTKSIHQLLSIYNLMPHKFTHKHLANAARKFTQLVMWHHSNLQYRNYPLVSQANTSIFRRFLNEVYQIDFKLAEVQQYLSLALFAQKLSKFKEDLRGGENEIAIIEREFKEKVLQKLNKDILSEMTFQQVYSLVFALWDYIDPQSQELLLSHIYQQLKNSPYCSCYHFALLAQHLRRNPNNTQLVDKIHQLCYFQAKKQLDEIHKYLHARNLIQIYNSFFQNHSAQLSYLLPIIKVSLTQDPNDTTTFATFFKVCLQEFKQNISTLKGQEQEVGSINKILQAGAKGHRTKYPSKQKEEWLEQQ